MNRAFPVLGHATCPDCFDGGPHQISTIKKKDGIISVKKVDYCRIIFIDITNFILYLILQLNSIMREPASI